MNTPLLKPGSLQAGDTYQPVTITFLLLSDLLATVALLCTTCARLLGAAQSAGRGEQTYIN